MLQQSNKTWRVMRQVLLLYDVQQITARLPDRQRLPEDLPVR